jgi:hypothetical protein
MLKPPEQFLSAQAAFFIHFSFFCCTCSWASCGKAILKVTFTFFTLGDCCLRPEFLHQLIVLFAEPLGQLLHELFTGYDCLSVFR